MHRFFRPREAEERMGLFGWLRSKRMAPPPELPVRYGLGPPPKKSSTPDELCPLCGGEVAEVRWVGHALERDGPGSTMWRGRCSACDTVLYRHYARNESPAWRAPVPLPEQLQAAVTAEELEVLTARFARLILFDSMWAEFLAARRPGDEVCRFDCGEDQEGFAVVRQGRPLAQFFAPDPDFERRLLEYAAKQAEPLTRPPNLSENENPGAG